MAAATGERTCGGRCAFDASGAQRAADQKSKIFPCSERPAGDFDSRAARLMHQTRNTPVDIEQHLRRTSRDVHQTPTCRTNPNRATRACSTMFSHVQECSKMFKNVPPRLRATKCAKRTQRSGVLRWRGAGVQNEAKPFAQVHGKERAKRSQRVVAAPELQRRASLMPRAIRRRSCFDPHCHSRFTGGW